MSIVFGVTGVVLFIVGLVYLTRYLEAKRMKDNEP